MTFNSPVISYNYFNTELSRTIHNLITTSDLHQLLVVPKSALNFNLLHFTCKSVILLVIITGIHLAITSETCY